MYVRKKFHSKKKYQKMSNEFSFAPSFLKLLNFSNSASLSLSCNPENSLKSQSTLHPFFLSFFLHHALSYFYA